MLLLDLAGMKIFFAMVNDQNYFLRSFKYGGCLGNGNRFLSKEVCESLCVSKPEVPVCSKPRAEGSCRGNFSRWFYNQDEGDCQEFSYTGCMGNNNRFMSYQECRATCQHDSIRRKSDMVCGQYIDEGDCKDGVNKTIPRWAFHPVNRR